MSRKVSKANERRIVRMFKRNKNNSISEVSKKTGVSSLLVNKVIDEKVIAPATEEMRLKQRFNFNN